MAGSKVAEIPGMMVSHYHADKNVEIDTWTTFVGVTVEDFKKAFAVILPEAKRNGVRNWIVDSSGARGTLSQDVQAYLRDEPAPALGRQGVRFFITIPPASALTKLSVQRYSAVVGPSGMELVQANSLEDALSYVKLKAVG